ncbi:MAG: hypothetical protein ACI9QL_001694 [Candidatus Omnitrophota bacterium]|jgi:hypothetical protein
MTTEENLRMIEEIWTNLEQNAGDIPSPAWHADVLSAREKQIPNGDATFSDWNEAKARIREKI